MRSRVVGTMLSIGGVVTTTDAASGGEEDIVVAEFHDMTANNINGSGGAFVAFGSGAPLSADVSRLEATYTAGEPLCFRVAASAGAAASAPNRFIFNQGDGPVILKVALKLGELLWVRSLSTSAVTGGYIAANLSG